jgi:hypothetical protein
MQLMILSDRRRNYLKRANVQIPNHTLVQVCGYPIHISMAFTQIDP